MCFITALIGILYTIFCATIMLELYVVTILAFLVLMMFYFLFIFTFIFLENKKRTIILKCPFCEKEAKFREEKLVKMFEE